MSKEIKFWFVFGLVFFALLVLMEALNTLAAGVNAVSAGESQIQSLASIPGQILEAIWQGILNLFGGAGSSSGGSGDTGSPEEDGIDWQSDESLYA